MTNEELVMLIKQGDDGYIPQLWEQVRRLIVQRADRFYRAFENKKGVELDDLIQSGYFAVLNAVKYYKPENELLFTTYLGNTLKTAFAETMGIRLAKTRNDVLMRAYSLDAPLPGTEDMTLLDSIRDLLPDGSDVGTEIIQSIYIKELRAALDLVLKELLPADRAMVELYYYFELSSVEIATMQGCSSQNILTRIDNTLWKIRHGKHKTLLSSFLESDPANEYAGNSFSSWKQSGMSGAERFVIHEEEKHGKER